MLCDKRREFLVWLCSITSWKISTDRDTSCTFALLFSVRFKFVNNFETISEVWVFQMCLCTYNSLYTISSTRDLQSNKIDIMSLVKVTYFLYSCHKCRDLQSIVLHFKVRFSTASAVSASTSQRTQSFSVTMWVTARLYNCTWSFVGSVSFYSIFTNLY
jgi:hypothetical protein